MKQKLPISRTRSLTREARFFSAGRMSQEEALERFDKGEKVYFVYRDEHTKWIYNRICRKVCKDRDCLVDHYDFYDDVCGVKMPLNRLTDEEYNILNQLATKTGQDCWFWLVERGGKNGKLFTDVVKDLENNKYVALRNALPIFAEGIIDLNFWAYGLTEEEKDLFLQLLDRFDIRDEYDRLVTARSKNDKGFDLNNPLAAAPETSA